MVRHSHGNKRVEKGQKWVTLDSHEFNIIIIVAQQHMVILFTAQLSIVIEFIPD